MSDRIYIMNEGKMVGEISAEEATQEKIMACILKSDQYSEGILGTPKERAKQQEGE
jgi:putative multiple sugar transport system ATP-binding protein